MTTKTDLIIAAQTAAANSLEIEEAKLDQHKKDVFAALSIPSTNWQFFSDHFNGARRQLIINVDQLLEIEPRKKTP